MSTGTGLRVNTGAASAANRNHYGIRRITTGAMLPLKRPFGSITAAYAWLDKSGYDVEAYEAVNLDR